MSYLILHKVRGEPAFDIADLIDIGDEAGWIIPTSGHRAYPSQWWELTDVCVRDDHMYRSVTNFKDVPADLPDHYACNDRNDPGPSKVDVLKMVLETFGQKIKRRL